MNLPPVPEAQWRVSLPIPRPGSVFDLGTLSAALLQTGRDSLHYGGIPARLSLDVQLAGPETELNSRVTFSHDPGEDQHARADHLLRCDAEQLPWRPHLLWPDQQQPAGTPTGAGP